MNIRNFVVPNGEIITTANGKKYQKVGLANAAGAVLVADIAGGATHLIINKLSHIPINKLCQKSTKTDKDIFRQAGEKAFAISGLPEKNVKILDVTNENFKNIIETNKKEIPKWLDKFPTLKKTYENKKIKKTLIVLNGRNAYYQPKKNIIFISKTNRPIALFHEMGHALNNKMGGIGKYLQKARNPVGALTGIAILTALFKRKKADGEKPQGLFDKVTTFIKENAGKLAFTGMVPMILEEGLASINGAKLAKGVLSPENLKKLNKHNISTFITYLGYAIGTTLMTIVISKVRDILAAPKEIK